MINLAIKLLWTNPVDLAHPNDNRVSEHPLPIGVVLGVGNIDDVVTSTDGALANNANKLPAYVGVGLNTQAKSLDELNIAKKSLTSISYLTYATQMADTQTLVNGQTCNVASYHSIFDNGDITMYWDAASTATHNGGTIRKPTSITGAGRWLAISTNEINIRQFGAKGDDISDDSTAINNTMLFASTLSSKCVVLIPTGIYLLNGARHGTYNSILDIYSNITIRGEGYNSVLKTANNYTAGGDYRILAPTVAGTITNFSISNVRFDGNASNNLVVGSTGANVRRAYSINIPGGTDIDIYNNWFENNPGRNVLNLGNNANTPSIVRARILFNQFRNVGGAITGNENQNDHSSIYLQCDGGLVHGNRFLNDTAFDPFAAPTRAVVALEIHGRNTIISNNIVRKYGTAGNCVAQVHDSFNNMWINNEFLELYSNALTLWTSTYLGVDYRNVNLTIRGNIIHMDNTANSGGNGIFQNTSAAITKLQIENLIIEDNVIMSEVTTPKAVTTYGIQITGANGCKIRRNTFRNIQGNAISFESSDADLDINNVEVSDNEFYNCGIHTAVTRIWGIYIANAETTHVFSNFKIKNNRFVKLNLAAGVAPTDNRGIKILGGGHLQNIIVDGDNEFGNINRAKRVEITTTTNNINVGVLPQITVCTTAAGAVSGLFERGMNELHFSDPVSFAAKGKVVTTAGGAVSGTWAVNTTYYKGVWIKTSTNKVLQCVKTGLSDGATEPAPTTLGIVLTDGTAKWVYRDTVIAVFG